MYIPLVRGPGARPRPSAAVPVVMPATHRQIYCTHGDCRKIAVEDYSLPSAIIISAMPVSLLHLFRLSKKARAVTQHTHNREKSWRGQKGVREGGEGE